MLLGGDKHWFPWLAEKLTESGNQVTIVPLPHPEAPQREEWLATLHATIGVPHDNALIITHSLGGFAVLSYLDSISANWSLGGLILVSGFDEPLGIVPELDVFLNLNIDYHDFVDNIDQICMIHSDNDGIVPPSLSLSLGNKLQGKIVEIPDGGHFFDSDGFIEFPRLLSEVDTILSS